MENEAVGTADGGGLYAAGNAVVALEYVDQASANSGVAANPALNGGPTVTHALLAGSDAIDASDLASCPTTDQRGYGRSGPCDIGAFEFDGIPPAEAARVDEPAAAVSTRRR